MFVSAFKLVAFKALSIKYFDHSWSIQGFLSNAIYDDRVTFDLAVAASEVLAIPLRDVLHAFGKYWVLNVGKKKYGTLMRAGGNGFEEFLVNLPNFHSRVMLIFADIKPPEFKVEKLKDEQ